MANRGKKYQEAVKKFDPQSFYSIEEAIKIAKETATTSFDSTVEVAIRLGIDTRKNDQQIRGAVVLPHGTGKTKKVLVLCNPDKEAEATAAGADFVGLDEFITKIEGGWTDIDVNGGYYDSDGKYVPSQSNNQ